MIPTLETLVNAGARINGHGMIVRASLANGQPEAARWLAEHGAHLRGSAKPTFSTDEAGLRTQGTPSVHRLKVDV